MNVSILIPVLHYSDLLEPLLSSLLSDPFEDKEIIVSIDEPDKNSTDIIQKYDKNVTFLLNKRRIGKVRALNNAVKKSKGDVLVFLDSDVMLKTSNFLTKTIREMDVDLLEFKKMVPQEGLVSKFIKYDYLAASLCSTMFNNIRRCLAINGSGFAIRRDFFTEVGGFKKVLSEDSEMGIQVYLRNRTFKYASNIVIYQRSPSTWKSWYKQRKRWAISTSQFIKNHYRDLAKIPLRFPKMTFVSLFFFFPALLSVLLLSPWFEQFLLISLIGLSLKFTLLVPILFFTTWGMLLFKNLIVFAIIYGLTSVMFYIASKKLGYTYKNREFLMYYVVYSPIWLSIFFLNFIIYIVHPNIRVDWKV